MDDEVIESMGAILGGRRWYEASIRRYDGPKGVYGGQWGGPIFVLTHNPPQASEDVTFVSEGIQDAVATAQTTAGAKNVVIFGAETAQQVIEAGLLDEIWIHLVPVLLGDGIRLYGAPGGLSNKVDLELTDLARSGRITDLKFRIRK
jgi:dihydrofolate reductase